MCAASTRITTAGASAAMPAGVMTTCCPISRRPKTSSAAPTNIMAPAARCRCRTGATPIRCRKRLWWPRPKTGIPTNPDFNGATQEGAGFFQTTTRRGRRASTAFSYLRPAMKRGNLHVETSALAQRILFEGRRAQRGRIQAGRPPRVPRKARKEILVSSGAYNSPQLLQLSGVGPADLLKQHGIEVVLDAPGVGNDLQDHLQVRLVTRCAQAITLNDIVNNPVRRIMAGAAICGASQGTADDRRRHLGRVLQDQSAAGVARYPDSLPAVLDRQDGREAACAVRLYRVSLPAAAREPRLAAHQERRSRRCRRKSASTISRPKPIAAPSSTASGSCARFWPLPR